ncbi:molybdopterin-dependent oxidoreductase [Burkholderia gladioli]|uniref:molybdopterin-dependent oxidoreductase n=1 Tax=Burkholderia gladioli TaxID=28095 RepID=UPI003B983A16
MLVHSPLRVGSLAIAVLVASLPLARPAAAKLPPLSLDVYQRTPSGEQGKLLHHFSAEELGAMPQYTIITSTPWTARSTFVGVRVEDILKKVGVASGTFRLAAYDGFISQTIYVSDVMKYHPIFATSMNGEQLQIRNFGPIFTIFPRDLHPDVFNNYRFEASFARQIKALEVELKWMHRVLGCRDPRRARSAALARHGSARRTSTRIARSDEA